MRARIMSSCASVRVCVLSTVQSRSPQHLLGIERRAGEPVPRCKITGAWAFDAEGMARDHCGTGHFPETFLFEPAIAFREWRGTERWTSR